MKEQQSLAQDASLAATEDTFRAIALRATAVAKRVKAEPDFICTPWTVLIDNREQTPWTFQSNACRMKGKPPTTLPLVVKTQAATLPTGDYSIREFQHSIAIERKSQSDAYSTFTAGRERFERELERMVGFTFACVIIECAEMAFYSPADRQISPVSLEESIRAWRQRFGVHFLFARGRGQAECLALKEMRRFWNDNRPHEAVEWRVL